jgi:PRD1 phage membrane DNA delivery
MGKETIEGLVTVAVAIVGVAMIAVLVSKNANTANVLTSGGQALATGISAATGPITSVGWTGGQPLDMASY